MAEPEDCGYCNECNCHNCITKRKIIGGLGTLVPGIVDEALSTLGTAPACASSDVVDDLVNVIDYGICVSRCLSALMFHCGLAGMMKVAQLIVHRPELLDYVSTDECLRQLVFIGILLTNLQTSRSLPPSSVCLPRFIRPFRSK
jgi:hypothetical protein